MNVLYTAQATATGGREGRVLVERRRPEPGPGDPEGAGRPWWGRHQS